MIEAGSDMDALSRALGLLMRLLLVFVFVAGGAWFSTAVPLFGGGWAVGACLGLLAIGLIFKTESALTSFCKRHSAGITLAVLLLYVVLLACAAYSELFDLGWFDWLP